MGRHVLAVLLLVLGACSGDPDSTDGLTGEELATEIGCFACHDDTDTDQAPTLRGIWGTDVVLEDGRSVTVDEVYVRTALTDPGAQIVPGFDTRMPTFGLSPSEVDRLVDYVRSLG